MSDSVLDRIRQNRHRPSVPIRDDTLITRVQQSESSPVYKIVQPLPKVAASDAKIADDSDNPNNALEELKAELAKVPPTNRHSAIVLEQELDQALTRYCKDNRITIEVFLEAAWVYASANPTAMEEMVAEAKRRYADRKRTGKLRRMLTMLEGKS